VARSSAAAAPANSSGSQGSAMQRSAAKQRVVDRVVPLGAADIHDLPLPPGLRMTLPMPALTALLADREVEYISEDRHRTTAGRVIVPERVPATTGGPCPATAGPTRLRR
jgi:hypothetical protein